MDVFDYLVDLLTGTWSKNGCHIDPLGRCVNGTEGKGAPGPESTTNSDEGCHIDPLGGCAGDR